MKKYLLYILLAGIASTVTACKKLSDINSNKNQPERIAPNLLLTKLEWDAFQEFNSSFNPLYTNRMIVQTDGESDYQYFKWNRGSFAPYQTLRNLVQMKAESQRTQEPAYEALASFFNAYYFWNLTLTFGDIPYAQALKGSEGYLNQIEYSTQKEVFVAILKDLNEAYQTIGNLSDLSGDIIYNGDLNKWKKAINVLRLKILISLSNKTSDTDLNVVKTFADIANSGDLFTSNEDNAQLNFLDQQDNRYPFFNSSTFGSGMYMSSTFVSELQARKDPRLFVFATQTKNAKDAGKDIEDFSSYAGGDPIQPYNEVNKLAAAGGVSKVNERYYKEPTAEPMAIVSYAEQEFILAEAAVRGWIADNATTHYNNAVKASFAFYEKYSNTYQTYFEPSIADNYLMRNNNNLGATTGNEAKLELILTQKYLSSFFQNGFVPYYDFLRTSYPKFRIPIGTDLPNRWMYPQSEVNNNLAELEKAVKTQFVSGQDNTKELTWWLKK